MFTFREVRYIAGSLRITLIPLGVFRIKYFFKITY